MTNKTDARQTPDSFALRVRTGMERLERRFLLSASASHADRDLGVATYNLYVGADVALPIAAISTGDFAKIVAADTAFWQTVQTTDFHARAQAIAKQIDAEDPALVGLQEAASYFVGPFDPTAQATTPLLNFENEILGALAARGLHYEVAARGTNADVEFPGLIDANPGLDDLRIVDHDIILARTDLPTSQLQLSDPQSVHFATNLVFPSPLGVTTVQRGWVSIDAKIRGKTVRFIDTHLDPYSPLVQRAQAAEMITALANTTTPVILVGDLNTAADGSTTATYGDFQAAGFADAWNEARPNDPGYTDGQEPDLMNAVSEVSKRIDFVLLRGDVIAKNADVIGEELADKTPSGLWPSDHAGVAATITVHARSSHSPAAATGLFGEISITHKRDLADEILA